MRVCFRADTAPRIGMGHLMRCLTLADVAAASGAQVDFISRRHTDSRADDARGRGYPLAWLPFSPTADLAAAPAGDGRYEAWLGEDAATDAAQTVQAIQAAGEPPDWLVVDHYGTGPQWEAALRPHCRRLMVLDDFPGRPHTCDLLLNQSLIDGAAAPPHHLCGPSYALLRPEFAQAHQRVRQRSGGVSDVFISFGGSDSDDFTAAAVQAAASALPAARIAVVLGANYAHRAALRARWEGERRIAFHVDTPQVCELMEHADMAIGAAGGMTWERCAVGLPSIVIAVVANQEGIAQGVHRAGAAVAVARAEATAGGLARAMARLAADPARLKALSAAALKLVDAQGARRVWACMMEAA